jgi:chemotaxis methyl-accepting protein methylase
MDNSWVREGDVPRAGSAETQAPVERARVAELDPDALEPLLALLRERDGLDLSGYRRATLARRVRNRMISAGAAGLDEYLARLRADPGEAARLLDRLTIKVSRFYRNRAAVQVVARALAAEVALAPRPLAAWSAGCGRGEEPYTLAILLADLGQGAAAPRVLATDIDPAALDAARAARYGPEALGEVPEPVRDRWLAPEGPPENRAYRVVPELRDRLAFRRHDLARDPPPRRGGFDLVACRNVLIYFDPPLQHRVLATLCEALAPGGLLWLGEAEWPAGDAAGRLVPVDRPARLFRLAEGGGRA